MFHTITKQELKDLMDSKELFVLLDVRGEDEWKAGHIEGSVLMPHWFVNLKIGDLVPNKDTKIVVYCLSGGRSAVAAKTLDDMGYANVWNLDGGYSEFQE
jgi:rhodanese-related sulfurtransferase